jgi:hypothetical protein
MRRGPKQAFLEAEAALADLASATTSERVRVVALHYRGAALRLIGDAQGTQRSLLDALALAEANPGERPKILNSLGTLYVVLGAYGAAEALLEHAAELHHRRGDAVGEAIACGQLGAAALGLGNLAKARTWLQRQEWLASQVGDAFGRARALTFLADVALDLGRPDDALELADLARSVARSTTPPLAIWLAYATRAAGRAKMDLHDKTAEEELRDARARFTQIGNSLGLALTEWDLVRLSGGDVRPVTGEDPSAVLTWAGPAWALASLGLPARVAGLLRDHADLRDARWRERLPLRFELEAADPASASSAPNPALNAAQEVARSGAAVQRAAIADAEEAFFAVAQSAPHIGVPREIALVYEAPGVLGDVSSRRTAAQRNLARLGALTIAPPGLAIATIRWTGAIRFRALPPERAACAAIGALPGTAQWAWPLATPAARHRSRSRGAPERPRSRRRVRRHGHPHDRASGPRRLPTVRRRGRRDRRRHRRSHKIKPSKGGRGRGLPRTGASSPRLRAALASAVHCALAAKSDPLRTGTAEAIVPPRRRGVDGAARERSVANRRGHRAPAASRSGRRVAGEERAETGEAICPRALVALRSGRRVA